MAEPPINGLVKAPFATTDGMQHHVRYAELTATGSVHRIVLPTGQPAWLVIGYHHEVRQVLNAPQLVRNELAEAILCRDWLPSEVCATDFPRTQTFSRELGARGN